MSLPGLAFASAMSSLTVPAGTAGLTTNTIGTDATSATGAKAVGRAPRGELRADVAAGAGAIVDHHRLTEELRQPGRERTREDVIAAAGRKRHDEADRLVRILLGLRRGRGERDAGEEQ